MIVIYFCLIVIDGIVIIHPIFGVFAICDGLLGRKFGILPILTLFLGVHLLFPKVLQEGSTGQLIITHIHNFLELELLHIEQNITLTQQHLFGQLLGDHISGEIPCKGGETFQVVNVQFTLLLLIEDCASHRVDTEIMTLKDLSIRSKVFMVLVMNQLEDIFLCSLIIVSKEGLVLSIDDCVQFIDAVSGGGLYRYIGMPQGIDILLIHLKGLLLILLDETLQPIVTYINIVFVRWHLFFQLRFEVDMMEVGHLTDQIQRSYIFLLLVVKQRGLVVKLLREGIFHETKIELVGLGTLFQVLLSLRLELK